MCVLGTVKVTLTAQEKLRAASAKALKNGTSRLYSGYDWVLLGFTGFYWVLLGFGGDWKSRGWRPCRRLDTGKGAGDARRNGRFELLLDGDLAIKAGGSARARTSSLIMERPRTLPLCGARYVLFDMFFSFWQLPMHLPSPHPRPPLSLLVLLHMEGIVGLGFSAFRTRQRDAPWFWNGIKLGYVTELECPLIKLSPVFC